MRILIDIGHPAHVHYFRNAINLLQEKGHKIVVTTRRKEFTIQLLDHYKIPYVITGKNRKTLIGKLLSILINDIIIFRTATKFKPDLFLSFLLPFPAHIGYLLRKPVIGFADTENATLSLKITNLFTNDILTPSSYMIDLGKKQICFDGFMELCYLHPNYFKSQNGVSELLNIKEGEKYVILRFVSWNAHHDIGHRGFDIEMKRKIVNSLNQYAKVLISSESKLPGDLENYKFKLPPHMMHDAIANAELLYGESATMASEAAVLGVPAFYHDNDGRGYTNEEEEFGLVFNYNEDKDSQESSLQKAIELLKQKDKQQFQQKRKNLLSNKIDVTAFMVWLIDKYPESINYIKSNSNFQQQFKQNYDKLNL